MKKLVLSLIILTVLSVMLVSLTGCTFKIETDENSVSASVDEETQSTFEGIVDWIVERLHRIFDTRDGNTNSNTTVEGA